MTLRHRFTAESATRRSGQVRSRRRKLSSHSLPR